MPLLDHTHASLRECSRMPSPLPVKGNTCIDDPDQSTDQIEDNSIQYGEIYVIELHKGKITIWNPSSRCYFYFVRRVR